MEDLEFFQKALNYQSFIVNAVAEIKAYGDAWGNDFCVSQIKEKFDKYINDDKVKEFFDLKNLTSERSKALRFQRWDEDMPNLWLFPLWYIYFIPYGTKVIDINGVEKEFTKDTDLDTRFGCVAFGVEFHENK